MCLSVPRRIPILLHGPGCKLGNRVPSSCALLGGFAVGAWVSLLLQHSAEREMSASACICSMLGYLIEVLLSLDMNYKCSAVDEMGDRLATIDIGRKFGSCALLGGGDGSPCNTVRPGPRSTFVPIKLHLDPCSRLATIDTGRTLGALYPFLGRGTGSPSNTVLLGLRPSIQPFGCNRHGPKIGGGCAPFLGRGPGYPSSTMWPGPRPTSILSGILIHPTVWAQ